MPPRLPWTTAALIALALIACKSPPKLTPAQKEQLTTALAGIRTRGAEVDEKRRKVLASAPSLRPRPDLGPCPIAIEAPAAAGSTRDFTSLGLDPTRRRLEVVPRKGLTPPGPGPMWRPLESEIGRYDNEVKYGNLESYGDDPGRELHERIGRLSDPGAWDYDFLLLADELIEPKAGEVSFSAGRLRGRLFVYSYRTGEIACAGDAVATNSDSVKVHVTGGVQNSLEASMVVRWDLEREALRSALQRLYKAGP